MIAFDHVSKSYGTDGSAAVNNLSFTVGHGEFLVLIGQSGCGKTTTLNMINRLIVPSALWLLFFPNAPYIFTDLIHLPWFYAHFWVDMVLILICALTGLVLGFVSLYLMHAIVARTFGRLTSWVFIALTAFASGFGIYLGRFLRLNSWDVVVQPAKVYHGVGSMLANPSGPPASLAFPVLFGMFLLFPTSCSMR